MWTRALVTGGQGQALSKSNSNRARNYGSAPSVLNFPHVTTQGGLLAGDRAFDVTRGIVIGDRIYPKMYHNIPKEVTILLEHEAIGTICSTTRSAQIFAWRSPSLISRGHKRLATIDSYGTVHPIAYPRAILRQFPVAALYASAMPAPCHDAGVISKG